VPLVYLHGHRQARYHAVWPVFIVGDDPATLTFTVAAGDSAFLPASESDDLVYGPLDPQEPRRQYVTATVRRRLHQAAFRERVLDAYRESCALCRLRHRELLDAAHIVADREPEGEPKVPNGLALCKLHHAAFDRFFLTVDPDYRILVRDDVLEEPDAPMLEHGLKRLHRERIHLPRRQELRPSPELLERRLEEFRSRGR
jgi:putative restriction endonuclease